jgi:hypothetical protein
MIPVASESIKLTASVEEVKMKDRFSNFHLNSAIFFAKNARELEKKYEKSFESLKDEEKDNIRKEYFAFTTSAIILSFMFVEAHINEFFDYVSENQLTPSDLKINIDKLKGVYPLKCKCISLLFLQEKERNSRAPAFDKYKFALDFFEKVPFMKGENPYIDCDLVRQLRNSFVHYNPIFRTSQIPEDKDDKRAILEKKLQGKFDLNPFYKSESDPFYPRKCLSYGSAEWSIKSCYEFVEDFYSKFDLKSGYERIMKILDEETPLDIKKEN